MELLLLGESHQLVEWAIILLKVHRTVPTLLNQQTPDPETIVTCYLRGGGGRGLLEGKKQPCIGKSHEKSLPTHYVKCSLAWVGKLFFLSCHLCDYQQRWRVIVISTSIENGASMTNHLNCPQKPVSFTYKCSWKFSGRACSRHVGCREHRQFHMTHGIAPHWNHIAVRSVHG